MDKKKVEQKIARKDLPSYETNPFAAELVSHVSARNKTVAYAGTSGAMVDAGTGEQLGVSAVIGIKHRVDTARFIKMYEGGIKTAFDLETAALRVFSKLLEAYRLDDRNFQDRIYFNFRMAQKDYEYGYSRQTFATGVTQLIKAKFIAEVSEEPGWYWINPAIFFKGDRLQIVNEFVNDKKKDVKKKLEDAGQQRLID